MRDKAAEQGLPGRRRWAIAAWVVLIISGPVSALGWLNLTNMLALASETQWRVAREAPGLCAGDNMLLHVSDPTVAAYTLPARILQGEPEPRSWNVLSMAPQDLQVKRTGPAALSLRVVGPRRHNWWERVQRNKPWQAGETHRVAALSVTIVEADERGPVAIAVDFNEPLEAPSLCFSHWHDGTLAPWKPPPVGETVTLPYERGPMELETP